MCRRLIPSLAFIALWIGPPLLPFLLADLLSSGTHAADWGGFGLLLGLLTSWMAAEVLTSRQRGAQGDAATNSNPPKLPMAVACACLLVVMLSAASLGLGLRPSRVVLLPALLFGGIGILLRVLSIRTLGSFFLDRIELRSGHELITSGIYTWIRHPSGLGLLLVCGGMAAIGGGVAPLSAMALLLGLVAWRCRLEDAMLLEAFGEQARAYFTRTAWFRPRRLR